MTGERDTVNQLR